MSNLISIIVPVYNSEKYLTCCIESILNQSHTALELILVNDGSTDSSLSICKHFEKKDKRILLINKKNEGVSKARNAGIKVASGSYIGFVDSDDFIEEKMYETLLKMMLIDDSKIGSLVSYTVNPTDQNKYLNSDTISSKSALKELFELKFPTSLWAYLYSREILFNIALNNNIHFFEDFEMNFRIIQSVEKISVCNEKLYNYRSNQESTNNQKINDKRISCLKIYDLVKENLKENNVDLIKNADNFRAHFLISNISSLIKTLDANKKYYEILEKEAKFLSKEILISKFVPLKYKAIIYFSSINIRYVCYVARFFKRKYIEKQG